MILLVYLLSVSLEKIDFYFFIVILIILTYNIITMKSMPARLENCRKIIFKNGWCLQGHSKAGERTGFWLSPLNILLDCGLSTYRSPKCMFLTHTHTDHSAQSTNIYTPRSKPLNGQNKLVGRPFVMHNSIFDIMEKLFCSYADLANGQLNSVNEKDSVWKMSGAHPFVITNEKREFDFDKRSDVTEVHGNIITIPGLYKLNVEILNCYHRTPCIGYGFITVSNKLKEKYKKLNSKEIRDLRLSGTEITEQKNIPQLAFYGDTTIKALSDHDTWKKYPIIVIECTIYYKKENDRRLDSHISWTQIEKYLVENQDNQFILIHSSMNVDDKWLTEFECKKKEELDIDNFCIWTDISY
jgi:ribonuclease BN (tRNA processing enzyme)